MCSARFSISTQSRKTSSIFLNLLYLPLFEQLSRNLNSSLGTLQINTMCDQSWQYFQKSYWHKAVLLFLPQSTKMTDKIFVSWRELFRILIRANCSKFFSGVKTFWWLQFKTDFVSSHYVFWNTFLLSKCITTKFQKEKFKKMGFFLIFWFEYTKNCGGKTLQSVMFFFTFLNFG